MNNEVSGYVPKYYVNSENVKNVLGKHILADGFDFVLDLNKSHGSFLFDKIRNKEFLDFFTCYASMPLGYNLKEMNNDSFINYIGKIALNKPSNSDVYTEEFATFVNTFHKVAVPEHFKYSFFISGGALAVENALKTAFDWKARQNQRKGLSNKGAKVIYFNEAFHGRTGYTMTLTNTDPIKIEHFPKFDWFKVDNPKIHTNDKDGGLDLRENDSISKIKDIIAENRYDIAAIIIEPIQGEGGDNHFRPKFLKHLKEIAEENDILLIFDEVQTGAGITGEMWACEKLGVMPDILSFGKKMQVCGILVSDKIDVEPDNVFKVSSRINSTWGGNLVDMVRSTKYLEIIEEQNILENVKTMGKYLQSQLAHLEKHFPQIVFNPRGLGLFCAFDVVNDEIRKQLIQKCFENNLIILPSGKFSVRFRPPLNISKYEIDKGMEIIVKSINSIIN
jgi:L-lysine 6-transaminase